MQIVLGSQINAAKENRNFGILDRPLHRASGQNRQNRLQQRTAEREREMQIRERENEFIKKIKEQMAQVKDSDMNDDLKRLALSSLEDQVRQIHEARAERERLALEREAQRNKIEQEERRREKEERARAKAAKHEDPEDAAERAKIRDMTLMNARVDKINSMNTTRSRLQSEATQLEQDVNNSRGLSETAAEEVRGSNALRGTTGPEHVVSWQTNSPDFRQSHLQNLNEGIAGLDVAINAQVAALYRDSQEMQDAQLTLNREKDDDEDAGYLTHASNEFATSYDLRL